MVDDATAARTPADLEIEIATLGWLDALAEAVRRSGTDRKWTELIGLADGPGMPLVGVGQAEGIDRWRRFQVRERSGTGRPTRPYRLVDGGR